MFLIEFRHFKHTFGHFYFGFVFPPDPLYPVMKEWPGFWVSSHD